MPNVPKISKKSLQNLEGLLVSSKESSSVPLHPIPVMSWKEGEGNRSLRGQCIKKGGLFRKARPFRYALGAMRSAFSQS